MQLFRALVDVFFVVESVLEDDEDPQADYVVEPTEGFKKYHLVMSSTMVDINRAPHAKLEF